MIRPITEQNKIDHMCQFLEKAPEGVVVEVGVYQGGSLAEMALRFPHRQFYGYDTFAGMPESGKFDNFHKAGDFYATIEEVQRNVEGFSNIKLVKGLYPESDDVRPSPVAMAHVDVDLYESTYNSFQHLAPLMAKGGRIYCDDSFGETCQGATLALCRFCTETLLVPATICYGGSNATYYGESCYGGSRVTYIQF